MSTIHDRARNIVSLDHFEYYNSPEDISNIKLECPMKEQYVLRCLIKTANTPYILPHFLYWVEPILYSAIINQKRIGIRHSFCYITVRSGEVKSVTDDEWHVDGYSQRITHIPEQNYIWCNHTPTEWLAQNIVFPSDFDPLVHNINSYIQDIANEQNVIICKPYRVYCIDPYVIHRRPKDISGPRTFVRISFTPIEIEDVNNTENYLLTRKHSRDGIKFRNSLKRYGQFV